MSSVGTVQLRRHWWGSRCGCESGGYLIDDVLGLDGHCTRVVQQQLCRLGADVSFAKVREHVLAFWQLPLSADTIRQICHGHGQRMRDWQAKDEVTPQRFAQAAGSVEFTVDAGKVNTREKGWRDLKIAVFQKRPAAAAATPAEWESRALPAPTACVAWAAIQAAKPFRKTWRGWSRRLGVAQTAELHALGDGAKWIWRSVERVFTGSVQTLDIYHACQRVAKTGERLYGEGRAEATAFFERGRTGLLESGWQGITQLMAEELEREDTPPRRAALEKMLKYFVPHVARLQYRDRLAAGQAIGSGVVEGWAKTLGLRLKARGARWRKANVQRIASLGCVRNGDQWSAYWSPAS